MQTDLTQAIERIKRELVMTLLEDICQFKQDIKTVVEAAEESRELRERLKGASPDELDRAIEEAKSVLDVIVSMNKQGCGTDIYPDLLQKLITAAEQSSTLVALVERLVEVLNCLNTPATTQRLPYDDLERIGKALSEAAKLGFLVAQKPSKESRA